MRQIEIKWSTEDVLAMADNMQVELTEEQADEVLENVYHYHDAEVGINWGVIDYHIENFLENLNKQQ